MFLEGGHPGNGVLHVLGANPAMDTLVRSFVKLVWDLLVPSAQLDSGDISTRTRVLLPRTLIPEEGIKEIKMQLQCRVTPAQWASRGDGSLKRRSSCSGCATGKTPQGK